METGASGFGRLRPWLAGAAVVVAAATCLAGAAPPPVGGPLPQEAYIWQRRWSRPLAEAVRATGGEVAGWTVLAAEVTWKRRQPRVARVDVDWVVLRKSARPVGLALRIGPYRGPFREDGEPIDTLVRVARAAIEGASAAGVAVRELQVDFDCASSKLDGYRRWLQAMRRRIGGVPVTFTALPTWLDQIAFARLAQTVDRYVLQVHSLDRPGGPEAPLSLCSPARAQAWVEQAARLGTPFVVALPTYGYTVSFGARGQLLGLTAEGDPPRLPAGGRRREVHADARAMAALVSGWTKSRPPALRGLVWYRLPTAFDRHCWPLPTLRAVMAGRPPVADLRLDLRRRGPLVEVVLRNRGETDLRGELAIRARWPGARLLAGDALRGFSWRANGPDGVVLRAATSGPPLRPGEGWTIAWLRFGGETDVTAELGGA